MITGSKYQSLRMLRLKYSGTSAQEQFEIINEFKLLEEYKIINTLRIQKEAYEKYLIGLKTEIDLNKQCKINTTEQENIFKKISSELKDINKQLASKDADKICVKEYYEKLVETLFDKKIPFDEIDLAETNKAYNDFFLKLSGS